MKTIAILGARGRLGRTVAKAFLDAGYSVRAITRDGKLPGGLDGAQAVAADALDQAALIRATEGMDYVFNGLNPLYTDWVKMCMPMAGNVVAACEANGALHLFPGNVYNFGSPLPAELREDLPFNPTTRKGRIRVEINIEDGQARIDVIDNGVGLPKAERHRLTEPYMTTRAKGTGLGLAIVRKVIEEHGGVLLFDDDATLGATGARISLVIPLEGAGVLGAREAQTAAE